MVSEEMQKIPMNDALKHCINQIDISFRGCRSEVEKDPAPQLTREIAGLIVDAAWPPEIDKQAVVDQLVAGEIRETDWPRLSSGVARLKDRDLVFWYR